MAWIESHQSLLTHRKTITLTALLGLDRMTVIGHLHALWWWALDNAPDGNLTRIPIPAVCEGSCYKGDQNLYIESLVNAGFIDRKGRGLFLHGWDDYAGKLIDRRKRNTERMRQARAQENDCAQHVLNTDRARASHRARTCEATEPYPTLQNPTLQNPTLPPPPTPAAAGGDDDFGRICQVYEENIGALKPAVKGRLEELTSDIPEMTAEWFEAAVKEAVRQNKRNLAYVEAILQRWQREGFQSGVSPGKNSRHGQVLHGTPRGQSLAGRFRAQVQR